MPLPPQLERGATAAVSVAPPQPSADAGADVDGMVVKFAATHGHASTPEEVGAAATAWATMARTAVNRLAAAPTELNGDRLRAIAAVLGSLGHARVW